MVSQVGSKYVEGTYLFFVCSNLFPSGYATLEPKVYNRELLGSISKAIVFENYRRSKGAITLRPCIISYCNSSRYMDHKLV